MNTEHDYESSPDVERMDILPSFEVRGRQPSLIRTMGFHAGNAAFALAIITALAIGSWGWAIFLFVMFWLWMRVE